MRNKFLVIGGDLRQILCASELAKRGYEVTLYGFDACYAKETRLSGGLSAAAAAADYILLPLPASADGERVNTPLYGGSVTVTEVRRHIEERHLIFGGMMPASFSEKYPKKVFDYAKNESFLIKNAQITVEGAFNIIFSETSFSLFGSNVLIAGYGRIGKLLAPAAAAFGARVSVSARKSDDLTWISVNGYNPVKYGELKNVIGGYDVIINTVPSRIFDSELIEPMNKDCLFLDLASKPGGIDFETAKKASLKVIWALSIPGKTAPYSSGKIICDTVLNYIEG
jgi:dipicolinate synthase subunit A